MKIFFDSSALAKRYIQEAGSEEVLKLCIEADEICVSIICYPEIISAFCRLKREGRLNQAGLSKIKRHLVDDLSEAAVLGLNEAVVDRAAALLEANALKAMDALHIATALEWSSDLFVSGDDLQLKAAKKAGLRVQPVG